MMNWDTFLDVLGYILRVHWDTFCGSLGYILCFIGIHFAMSWDTYLGA